MLAIRWIFLRAFSNLYALSVRYREEINGLLASFEKVVRERNDQLSQLRQILQQLSDIRVVREDQLDRISAMAERLQELRIQEERLNAEMRGDGTPVVMIVDNDGKPGKN